MKTKTWKLKFAATAVIAGLTISSTNIIINRNQPSASNITQLEGKQSNDDLDYLIEIANKNSLPLSQDAIDAINAINTQSIENPCIDILNISKENARIAYMTLPDKEDTHQNTSFYDETTNTIQWENLTDRVYENSLEQEQVMDSGITLTALPKEKIEKYLKEYQNLLEQVIEDYPDYDVEQLACKLEGLSMMQSNQSKTQGEYTVMASTYNNQVIFYPENETEFPLLQTANNLHEGVHLLENLCIDYTERLQLVSSNQSGGVSVKTPGLEFPSIMDKYCVERYNFSFLEEIYAELYSKDILGMSQSSYLYYDEILDLMQLSIGLDSNYQIDSFLEDLLYQDPISFITRFQVYGQNQEASFLDNLKMLKSLDLILSGFSDKYTKDLEKENITTEQALATLTTSAFLQLEKIFYSNLITLNEANTLSLEDNICLMKLYMDAQESAYFAVQNENLINHEEVWFTQEDSLLQGKSSSQEEFIAYLEKRYGWNKQEITLLLNTYDYETDYQFPTCLTEMTRQYYHESMIEHQNHKTTDTPYTKELVKGGKTH